MAVGDRYVLDEKEGRTYNRIDKKDEWEAANPVLEIGEIGIEKDGLLMNIKIGDGQTAWNALGYRFKQCPYEVGDIFMTLNATDPAVRWPGTKWEAFAPGRVLIGAGTGTDSRGESRTFKIGDTGGEYQHQLTTGELASHQHVNCIYNINNQSYKMVRSAIRLNNQSAYQWVDINASDITTAGGSGGDPCGITYNTGNNNAHNNQSPYMICYYYRRIS